MADNEIAISVKHIHAYDAIAATGSTIAAAAELGISQSNASRLLHQLELYLGVRLFERDKNRLSMTREGLALGPEIRAISDRLTALKVTARELENGRSLEIPLRLAFPASLSVTLIPRLIKRFLAENGPVRIEVASGNYVAIERMIADGQADIGFTRLPSPTPGLREEEVLPSRNICVMHPDHGLAKSKTLTVADLKSRDLILLNRERPVRHELEALFYKQGLRQRPAIEAHSVGCACALAAEGLGIAIVSELLALEYGAMPLVFVPLEPALIVDYAIVSSDQTPLPKSAAPFLRYLREWYEKQNITAQPSGR
ncbi:MULTISPECIES: LysR family transcriptional regulator [Agrobacterium]|uniref:Ben and cat operon transcriptional regulator n=1 Tax=Agrobacterium rosae TaxID=1972867 RepID=A0A1R3U4Y3_9HYPH|nr:MULTISPECIES: LysR family transcriptional regulator [Agrobacterium]KAA3509503.1 LysR family transcriptional regulator [Agrobacterium rosae]KAA3516403.1 LysR family transcriptional regulator [Agrobacterium rosae]MBN7808438.1 LysR family transcriptional regulator [Agrobacterium rosae]MCM2434911.1 LysR family transcriptional regulator [Agrobacterium rosae]MDX8304586.1 LysR family transcriptional regulator [Agrobacterium rosae]